MRPEDTVAAATRAVKTSPARGTDRAARLEQARSFFERSGRADADLATALEKAAELCAAHPERARPTWALARAQWLALGRNVEAERVASRAALDPDDGSAPV